MAFKLIEKKSRININDQRIRITKTAIRFPMKLRKKEKGFFNYVDIFFDEEQNKVGFQFTDDELTGYTVRNNYIQKQHRARIRFIPIGAYEVEKEGDMYIIQLKDSGDLK